MKASEVLRKARSLVLESSVVSGMPGEIIGHAVRGLVADVLEDMATFLAKEEVSAADLAEKEENQP